MLHSMWRDAAVHCLGINAAVLELQRAIQSGQHDGPLLIAEQRKAGGQNHIDVADRSLQGKVDRCNRSLLRDEHRFGDLVEGDDVKQPSSLLPGELEERLQVLENACAANADVADRLRRAEVQLQRKRLQSLPHLSRYN